jgi:hypothetical protein
VAEAITEYVDRDVPILIHSMNPTHRGLMASRLRQAGFAVEGVPSRRKLFMPVLDVLLTNDLHW